MKVYHYFIEKSILPKEIGIDKNKPLLVYYNVIVKYVAPIFILAILVTGLLDQFGVLVI